LSRSLRGLLRYARSVLDLKEFLSAPGDGRVRPQIPGAALVCALLSGIVLRAAAYSRIEQLGKSGTRWPLGGRRRFGDDALAYFTERMDPAAVRQALVGVARRAKRNKALAKGPGGLVGLAVDGSRAGRFTKAGCPLCRPHNNGEPEAGHYHALCALSVVGAGPVLPLDAEPYGPGDSEYAAGQRLIQRAVAVLGKRFAQYLVADGEFATAPFLHTVTQCGLYTLARLKENLPTLLEAARARFVDAAPTRILDHEGVRIELWDADDFEPWQTLNWQSVRVLRYRYTDRNGTHVDAYWLTNMPKTFATTATLFLCAKSRWQIENQGFNDAKNRYGLTHTPHHHQNSVLIHWLLVFLALCIERLYRLCYLRRGNHPPLSAQELHDSFWRSLNAVRSVSTTDTS
jgi:hypothetical protein